MSKINLGRMLTGGLLAGLVLNIGEFLLNEVVLREQMTEFFRRYNIPPPGSSFLIVAVLLTFLLGILIVWVYTLIRPRLGAGPMTAVVAGVIAWLCIYVYTGIINGLVFASPLNLMVIGMIWGLVQYAIAAVAGAWVYREA